MHTIMALYLNSITDKVNGNIKSSNPATLFITVCLATNFLQQINPEIKFIILITAMNPIHMKSQVGKSITGNSFIKATTKNMKSVTVSNLEPNLLTEFAFLQQYRQSYLRIRILYRKNKSKEKRQEKIIALYYIKYHC